MDKQTYIFSIIMYILGTLLHLFWIKIPSMKRKAKQAGVEFRMSDWVISDYHIVVGNLIFGIVLVIGASELLHLKPDAQKIIKWFFFFMGAFGSSVAMAKFAKFEKVLTGIVDDKLDGIRKIEDDEGIDGKDQ